MILNVFERLLIRNIIPEMHGWTYEAMKEALNLYDNCFTPEEEEVLQLKQTGSQVTWRVKNDDGLDIPQEKDMQINSIVCDKFRDFLVQLDHAGKLEFGHRTLYEKFVKSKGALL